MRSYDKICKAIRNAEAIGQDTDRNVIYFVNGYNYESANQAIKRVRSLESYKFYVIWNITIGGYK